MKMRKTIMMLAAVLCCAMISTVFTACGSDDGDSPADNRATTYTFKLTVKAGTGADDQQDIVKTVVTMPKTNGETETQEFSEFIEEMSVQPAVNFNNLPGECSITISESLLPDADITQKEKYGVGLHYKLEVISYDANGGVIDYKVKEEDSHMIVPAANLTKLYPKSTTLKFTVDKSGKITQ